MPLVRTKLHRPELTGEMVVRERLLELLAGSLEVPLTLVAAPAGYGKSVLASQWAGSLEQPSAWLSLDEMDSDIGLFLAYLMVAIRAPFPDACNTSAALLEAPEPPPMEIVAGQLINDLDAITTDHVIVFDDYHRIDRRSPVHEMLARLLEHPPRQTHIVLITRRDPPLPVASMRASGQLVEVRLQDLRFTTTEIARLLAASGGPAVSPEAIARLEQAVEGWAVGLQLVMLALRRAEEPESFLNNLRQGISETEEYLFQEVLAAQPPEIRHCMVRSSILDRFCPELLEAVCPPQATAGPAGFGGGAFVDQMRELNLFLIALDAQGEWFRYHHLFRELLAMQLQQEASAKEIAALHLRASEWFESRGLITESIGHALEAGDTETAAAIVASNRRDVLNADQWYLLESWLSRLPDAVVQQSAELLLARAWLLVHHFRFEDAFPVLDRAELLLAGDQADRQLQGEVSLLRGYILFFVGQGADSLKLIEEALELVPLSFYEARAQAEVIFALSSQMVGRKEQAIRRLDELLVHYDSPDEMRKSRLLITYAFMHIISGDLVEAEISNQEVRAVAERGHYAYAEAWTDYLQGLIALHRHELERAEEYLKRSASQRAIHFKRAAVDSIAGLMLTYEALGRSDDVLATQQLLHEYVASLDDPALGALEGSSNARLAIMQGRPESALCWLASDPPAGGEAMLWWLDVPAVTGCRALLALGSPSSLDEAQERLAELVESAEAHHNSYQLIDILLLQSMACEKQGKREEALPLLERALSLAEPGGIVFPFLELGPPMAGLLRRLGEPALREGQVLRLLAAFEQSGLGGAEPASAGDRIAVDSLTERELQILQLLAQRLYNKEIAERLLISPYTVSDHLKHIYQKLYVKNRRQAVERAMELGILVQNSK